MTWEDDKNFRTNKLTGSHVKCGQFVLVIHKWMGCDDIWFFTVNNGPFERVQLEAKTLTDAKQEAGGLFNKCLSDARIDLES
jgi:hypothetical protein